MADNEIILRIEPIANGFLVTGSKSVESYRHAQLPQTYVATRDDVVAGLTALFEVVDALTSADASDEVDF